MVVEDWDALGRIAALIVAQQLHDNPLSVLALPTGKTPLTLYCWLVRMYDEGTVDFSANRTFNLDEFYGIDRDNPGSFAAYMRREFFGHVNLRPENINLLDPLAHDVDAECRCYERKIRDAGGIDLAILGIGQNGHLAFNEPGSPFDSRTRLVRLTPQTIKDNRSFFRDLSEVPHFALTMGLGTIMEARHVLLLASGRRKAKVIARALQGAVTVACPASVLQQHPKLTVVVDKDAAARLLDVGSRSR